MSGRGPAAIARPRAAALPAWASAGLGAPAFVGGTWARPPRAPGLIPSSPFRSHIAMAAQGEPQVQFKVRRPRSGAGGGGRPGAEGGRPRGRGRSSAAPRLAGLPPRPQAGAGFGGSGSRAPGAAGQPARSRVLAGAGPRPPGPLCAAAAGQGGRPSGERGPGGAPGLGSGGGPRPGLTWMPFPDSLCWLVTGGLGKPRS